MTLNAEDIEGIIFYRRQKSYAALKEADDLIKDSHWNLIVQRLYYAAYYMVSALLIKNHISAHTHNGVVGQLGLHFISTGKISREDGRLYSRLLQNRITGDYNDFFDFTEEDVLPLIPAVKTFVSHLEKLIEE